MVKYKKSLYDDSSSQIFDHQSPVYWSPGYWSPVSEAGLFHDLCLMEQEICAMAPPRTRKAISPAIPTLGCCSPAVHMENIAEPKRKEVNKCLTLAWQTSQVANRTQSFIIFVKFQKPAESKCLGRNQVMFSDPLLEDL